MARLRWALSRPDSFTLRKPERTDAATQDRDQFIQRLGLKQLHRQLVSPGKGIDSERSRPEFAGGICSQVATMT